MGRLTRKMIQDSDLKTGDLYNDGEYSGKVKSVSSDEIVIESQNEDGEVVDITIPVTDDASEAEIIEALMDPEFVSDMIEAASNGENKVESYRDNGDGTVDVKIARPVTQEEAQYLNEVGIFVGLEGMNKAGWITVSANPIADSVKYRVYYPSKSGSEQMEFEEFEGSEDEAKGAAEDFAANFGREKTIIHKVTDSDDFEQFIGEILFRKKATCPKTGDWKLEGNKLLNNGEEVADLNGKSFAEAFDIVEEAVKKAKPIKDAADPDKEWDAMISKLWDGEKVTKPEHWTEEDWIDFVTSVEDFQLSDDNPEGTIMKQDGYTAWFETPGLESELDDDYYEGVEDSVIGDSDLNVGDEYNDGKYSGVVTDITSDGISLESEDENGNKVEVTVPVSDSAVHTIVESNINDIFDKGTTTVVYDPEETDPADIVMEIEDELALGAAPGEEVPELDFEVIDDNTIEVFVV